MRIAILGPLDHPIGEPYAGGLERQTAQLAKGFSDLGHEVTLFAHPASTVDGKTKLEACHSGYWGAMRSIRSGTFDVVQNNTTRPFPAVLALGLRTHIVTTLHTPPYKSLAAAAVLSRLNSRHRFVGISEFCAADWHRYTGGATIIHNGIEIQKWPFCATVTPGRAVWSGRLSPEKGAEFAIQAAQLAGFRLDIAGPVHDTEYFETLIKPFLSDTIRYYGHLNAEALSALIGKAEVGLFTSVWDEPFGLVLPETLACGTPVAGFNSGAAPEIITEDVGVLVPKRDVAALAGAMSWAATKSRFGCRARAEANFRVERMVAAYADLYSSLLA